MALETQPTTAANPTAAPETTISPFLNLAPELRNRIYAFTFEDFIFEPGVHAAPGILAACRQNYDEAIGLFYATVAFEVKGRDILLSWLTNLPVKQRALIKEIRCGSGMYQPPPPSPPPSPGVIRCCFGMGYSPSGRAQTTLDQIRKLLREAELSVGQDVLKVCLAENGYEPCWTSEPDKVARERSERDARYTSGCRLYSPSLGVMICSSSGSVPTPSQLQMPGAVTGSGF